MLGHPPGLASVGYFFYFSLLALYKKPSPRTSALQSIRQLIKYDFLIILPDFRVCFPQRPSIQIHAVCWII